ncbi:DUF1127 domain-containing protein [Seohaeicola zhoushanensis]|uniref:YjiS-like domain-containing protein n=1 Tax=Seohaeicola zhoushanensis TaxID=1569283 RepID=A0A8J3M8U6_9RHOB|nr:DUF1127 domain-containing protein [Seohaeicola zhoushanensis]GHF56554.1 hypothetical protein GCM10017056_30210 [Seohaeicola zhoushanensis]
MTRLLTQPSLALLAASPRLPVIAMVALRFAGAVTQWDQRSRTRRALSSLDDHMLRDIGVTHAQARKEAKRPFWQP